MVNVAIGSFPIHGRHGAVLVFTVDVCSLPMGRLFIRSQERVTTPSLVSSAGLHATSRQRTSTTHTESNRHQIHGLVLGCMVRDGAGGIEARYVVGRPGPQGSKRCLTWVPVREYHVSGACWELAGGGTGGVVGQSFWYPRHIQELLWRF